MIHLRLVYIALFVCLANFTSAQDMDMKKLESEADLYFSQQRFQKVLPLYLKLDSIYPSRPKFIYRLGICYLATNQIQTALPYFNTCLKEEEKYPATLYYNAAKCNHLLHKFDEAEKLYEKYYEYLIKNNRRKKKHLQQIAELVREIGMCANGKEFMQKEQEIKISNLGEIINTKYDDYAPIISADHNLLIFTSSRENNRDVNKETDDEDGYNEEIYFSEKINDEWSSPKNMGDSINTAGHDAGISLSPEGNILVIYRFTKESLINKSSGGDLWYTENNGESWSNPQKFPETINSKYWESSACFSHDGRILFFTSNREGGYGGTDIYYSKQINKGIWAEPINMGPKINTAYDEESPFLHPDGKTLYFSSNGHKSMGGFDIFVSHFNEEKQEWSRPENLGFPVNSAHDDIYFSWSADGKKCFFSSIRLEGFGNKDIYTAEFPGIEVDLILLKGEIKDTINNKTPAANIKVTDPITGEITGIFHSNQTSGKYIMILPTGKKSDILISCEGYHPIYITQDNTKKKGFIETETNFYLIPEK
ncbi:MAG: hypothetical protein ACK40G_09950 [Cytophagaceae bacterium]